MIGAVDATLLELFGQFEGQEKLFDHVTNQVIKGYKLYVLFEVETRYPLAFVLHTPGATTVTGAPKGDAEYLAELIEQVKQEFGLDHFGCVLFGSACWAGASTDVWRMTPCLSIISRMYSRCTSSMGFPGT